MGARGLTRARGRARQHITILGLLDHHLFFSLCYLSVSLGVHILESLHTRCALFHSRRLESIHGTKMIYILNVFDLRLDALGSSVHRSSRSRAQYVTRGLGCYSRNAREEPPLVFSILIRSL